MTVMGVMMKPAQTRAMAPVVRFAMLESLGSEDEYLASLCEAATSPLDVRMLERATCCRRAFRVEK